MAIGDALSKKWTYGSIEDMSRRRIGDEKEFMRISPSLALEVITYKTQKIAKRLNGAKDPWYFTTLSTLTMSGSANPYTVDLSLVNPFIDKIMRVAHITGAGVRTPIDLVDIDTAEVRNKHNNAYDTAIYAVHEGDSLRIYAGGGFTITTATDKIELKYSRQPKIGSTASTSLAYDATFTVASDGVTISNFTGILSTYLGGLFVGTDSASNKFAYPITSIASDLSTLTISVAVTAGAGTSGYIIPPNSYAYTTTRGTYIDLPDCYIPLLIDEVVAEFIRYGNDGQGDVNLEAKNDKQLNDIYTIVATERMQQKTER